MEKNEPQKKPATKRADVDEMEGLFVDAVPESKKSKAARASDRRRERGQAPQPAGVPDTRTSLPQKERDRDRENRSQMSELNPKSFAKATLTCTRGPEEGLSLNLIDGSYTVGRARENSFVLKDIAASRRHLRIDVDGRGARVIDMGSGNGTRVNGRRIGEHELKHGDKIEIGGSVLLFQEKGKPPASANNNNNGSGAVDDAQERVIRAAEKLAAELSERMRFGEDGGQSQGFEDGHIAKTRAIPPAAKNQMDQELARQKQAQAQAKPEKLWKETFTNLPLDKVVPADDPLRGPRAAEQMPPPQPPQVAVRQPLPRPLPLPMPPPPADDEIEISASSGRSGSFMTSLLVTALVVVIGGAAVLGALVITRHKGAESDKIGEEKEQQQAFDDAMSKAERALDNDDWATAIEYATTALQMRPNDKGAARYQREAKKHLDELKKPTLAPTPPPPAPTPAPTPPETAAAPPPPAPPPPAPAPAPLPRKAKAAATSTPPDRAAPAATPAPAPAPKKKGSRGTMTEDAAQARFEDAVNALRDRDTKKGCKILDEVADKAPVDSRWKEKAENLYSRRCGE